MIALFAQASAADHINAALFAAAAAAVPLLIAYLIDRKSVV